jgi:hypothetical protein
VTKVDADAEATRLLAKLLREARDTDVWQFVSPAEVWQYCPYWRLNWAAAGASGSFCLANGRKRLLG